MKGGIMGAIKKIESAKSGMVSWQIDTRWSSVL
jgi:hypothetical protein